MRQEPILIVQPGDEADASLRSYGGEYYRYQWLMEDRYDKNFVFIDLSIRNHMLIC
jgi:hypothetical protein